MAANYQPNYQIKDHDHSRRRRHHQHHHHHRYYHYHEEALTNDANLKVLEAV